MIRYFISDIDGCLAVPFQAFQLPHLQKVAELSAQADRDAHIPKLSICSGRSYSYVEAMTQVLGIRTPVLFEAGGGMFDPVAVQVYWNPAFTEEMDHQLNAVRFWLQEVVASSKSLMFDYAKRTQAGVVGGSEEDIMTLLPEAEAFVAAEGPDLVVFHTEVSIDVLPTKVTKAQSMQWLADTLGCDIGELAYIGDSSGDLGALAQVGFPFAPANAVPEVRVQVPVVTAAPVIEGVLEAYHWCIEHNTRLAEAA